MKPSLRIEANHKIETKTFFESVLGSFQPNSNRGVHPMSWIFFLLSILVDIIETKKFCEFEISTPFRFRVAAIRNMGGQRKK